MGFTTGPGIFLFLQWFFTNDRDIVVFLDVGQDVVIGIHIGDQIIDPVKSRIAESEVESHLGVIT